MRILYAFCSLHMQRVFSALHVNALAVLPPSSSRVRGFVSSLRLDDSPFSAFVLTYLPYLASTYRTGTSAKKERKAEERCYLEIKFSSRGYISRL